MFKSQFNQNFLGLTEETKHDVATCISGMLQDFYTEYYSD